MRDEKIQPSPANGDQLKLTLKDRMGGWAKVNMAIGWELGTQNKKLHLIPSPSNSNGTQVLFTSFLFAGRQKSPWTAIAIFSREAQAAGLPPSRKKETHRLG